MRTVIAAFAVISVGVLAALMLGGCSSSSSSPADIIPWYDSAQWVAGDDFTSGSTRGTSLEWDGDDSFYTHAGWTQSRLDSFWRYDISTDSWIQLNGSPISPYWSTSLAWTGGDEMYATFGNGTSSFWRYTISLDDWTSMESFPVSGVRRMGHALVWPGSGDYVYLAKGDMGSIFARYDTTSDEWEYLADVPQTMGNGTQISWGGGTRIFAAADHLDFFEYDIATDTWETRAALPGSLHHGAWMCYDGDESLFLAQGDTTAALFRYDIGGDTWESMPDIPVDMMAGASMVCANEALYVLPGGGSTDFWIFKP